MEYEDSDLDLLANDDTKQEAMYPIHHKDSKKSPIGKETTDVDEESEDDDDEDLDEDEKYMWNLRKCSSATLDLLANVVDQNTLISVLLPCIQSRLNSSNWKELEVGILAVGAISEGCFDIMIPHLQPLTSFIIHHMDHNIPLVRSISCWSLGRYSSWISQDESKFTPVFIALLNRMVNDPNRKVQCSSTSAVASLLESTGDNIRQIESLIPTINQTIRYCLHLYYPKARIILYGLIEHYCDLLGPSGIAAYQTFAESLLDLYLGLWIKNSDGNNPKSPLHKNGIISEDEGNEIFPFLESFANVLLVLPIQLVRPVCLAIFQRAFSIFKL